MMMTTTHRSPMLRLRQMMQFVLDDMLKAEKKLVEEDAVVAPVYHRGSAVLTKSNVKNLISHPIGVPIEFKYASFE